MTALALPPGTWGRIRYQIFNFAPDLIAQALLFFSGAAPPDWPPLLFAQGPGYTVLFRQRRPTNADRFSAQFLSFDLRAPLAGFVVEDARLHLALGAVNIQSGFGLACDSFAWTSPLVPANLDAVTPPDALDGTVPREQLIANAPDVAFAVRSTSISKALPTQLRVELTGGTPPTNDSNAAAIVGARLEVLARDARNCVGCG